MTFIFFTFLAIFSYLLLWLFKLTFLIKIYLLTRRSCGSDKSIFKSTYQTLIWVFLNIIHFIHNLILDWTCFRLHIYNREFWFLRRRLTYNLISLRLNRFFLNFTFFWLFLSLLNLVIWFIFNKRRLISNDRNLFYIRLFLK
jgi:hypothetical protein